MRVVLDRTMKQIIASAKSVGAQEALEGIEPVFTILNAKSAKIRKLTAEVAKLNKVLQYQRTHIGTLKRELAQVRQNIVNGVYTTPASGYHVVASCSKAGNYKAPATSDLSLSDASVALTSLVRSGCDDCVFTIEVF